MVPPRLILRVTRVHNLFCYENLARSSGARFYFCSDGLPLTIYPQRNAYAEIGKILSSRVNNYGKIEYQFVDPLIPSISSEAYLR